MTPLLRLDGISKGFPGVQALQDVSLDVHAGEVHAVMGENGAGKSTLMKIAAGLYRPDAGSIAVDGAATSFAGPADATAHGIHTVFQELTVLDNLDVGRNVMMGHEPGRGPLLDRRALRRAAQEVLDRLGIALDAATPAARLSTGARQMVEIARACATAPRVLILDEPTSSLGSHEEETLFALIDRLKAMGVGIVYITHRMSEVFRLADRLTVLRDGRHVVTGPAAEFDRDSLIRAMVGRDVEDRSHGMVSRDLPPALSVARVTRGRAVRGATLRLHEGEVLGLAGLMGAGRTELARLMAGADQPDSGSMVLFGAPYAPRDVAEAIAAGVVYVPEDRKDLGLVLSLSVAENISLPAYRQHRRAGLLDLAALRRRAADWAGRLGVKAPSPAVRVDTLSGGNQQKVVLAKWLAMAPRVVLLDEPTRGVDVGAKAEIHARIRALAADGAAVLVISSELPEVLSVADRIAVMAGGRVVGTVPAAKASEESLLALAFAEDEVAA
ncbi:sugar ABC transporter ATP-binding protein [Rhodobacteraceae bacterium CCMM004]|nr:sugar ABC transporter ATP-binding protein [Rhodobacteraceae bacterium CCMM004]